MMGITYEREGKTAVYSLYMSGEWVGNVLMNPDLTEQEQRTVMDLPGKTADRKTATPESLEKSSKRVLCSIVDLVCHCGMTYAAKRADIARGWGKTCSKSCAATKRSYGKPDARHTDGSKVSWGKKYKRVNPPNDSRTHDDDYYADDDPSWDAHKSYL